MTRLRTPLLILGMLQVLDLVSTYFAIHAGGHEQNPIAVLLLAIGGFGALVAMKLGLFSLAVASARLHVRRGLTSRALRSCCLLGVVYAGVVAWNTIGLATAAAA